MHSLPGSDRYLRYRDDYIRRTIKIESGAKAALDPFSYPSQL
jgi:hypothetical protein